MWLTVKVVVAVAVFPAVSVAVRVMVFTPRPTIVPAAGLWVMVTEAPQAFFAALPSVKSGTEA